MAATVCHKTITHHNYDVYLFYRIALVWHRLAYSDLAHIITNYTQYKSTAQGTDVATLVQEVRWGEVFLEIHVFPDVALCPGRPVASGRSVRLTKSGAPSNRYGLNFLGARVQTVDNFLGNSFERGNLQHHFFDYSSDVEALLIVRHPGQVPGWRAPWSGHRCVVCKHRRYRVPVP